MTYAICKQLKELGLTQKRHDHARYYINENTIAYFEDIKNAFKSKEWFETRKEEPADWTENWCYIPELLDLIGTLSYELTIDAAVYQFVDKRMKEQKETIERSEQAIHATQAKP